jgi:hypothetical protein
MSATISYSLRNDTVKKTTSLDRDLSIKLYRVEQCGTMSWCGPRGEEKLD